MSLVKGRLALELQAARDDRKAQRKEFEEMLSELKDTLTKIQAQFKVEAQLLNLIRPAGENKWQESGKFSNLSHTRKKSAKSTR